MVNTCKSDAIYHCRGCWWFLPPIAQNTLNADLVSKLNLDIVIITQIKEVIKEVTKEIIKEVPVDKLVIKEVPKEIIKHKLIHVPMYTNDLELLKRGINKG